MRCRGEHGATGPKRGGREGWNHLGIRSVLWREPSHPRRLARIAAASGGGPYTGSDLEVCRDESMASLRARREQYIMACYAYHRACAGQSLRSRPGRGAMRATCTRACATFSYRQKRPLDGVLEHVVCVLNIKRPLGTIHLLTAAAAGIWVDSLICWPPSTPGRWVAPRTRAT